MCHFQHGKLKINQLFEQTCVEVTNYNTHTLSHTHMRVSMDGVLVAVDSCFG
jgi:hypothetical protein